MYLQHYGLNQAPFAITPDPRFVFLSARHEDALAHLRYGISQGGGGGFVQLTGEVGTGKTTLCRLLLEELPADTEAALILNPLLEPVQLLETLCEELGVNVRAAWGNAKKLTDRLNRYLLKAHAQGKTVVVLIDEAQNLSPAALEQVRLLTNLETATQKLLQIVLVGQPELRQILRRADLRQLSQRITARYHLEPLSAAETSAYVRHRLRVAGAEAGPFSRAAERELHRQARGVPRLINIIADRALLAGYARKRTRVGASLVRQAAAEVRGERPAAPGLRVVFAALGLIGLGLATYVGWQAYAPPARSAADRVGTVPAADPQTVPAAESELPTEIPPAIDGAALEPTWRLWLDERGFRGVPVGECAWDLPDALRCVERYGDAAALHRLERPVLAALGEGYAVIRVDRLDRVRWTTPEDRGTVPLADFERAWSGRYWDLFRMPGYVPDLLREGDRGPGVLWVKQVAEQATPRYFGDPDDPYFGPSLKRWAMEFQASAGLPADGLIDRETLQYLSRFGDGT